MISNSKASSNCTHGATCVANCEAISMKFIDFLPIPIRHMLSYVPFVIDHCGCSNGSLRLQIEILTLPLPSLWYPHLIPRGGQANPPPPPATSKTVAP